MAKFDPDYETRMRLKGPVLGAYAIRTAIFSALVLYALFGLRGTAFPSSVLAVGQVVLLLLSVLALALPLRSWEVRLHGGDVTDSITRPNDPERK
jgi:FtsH-binding integral membrane protein